MQNLTTEICVLICTFTDTPSLLRLQQTCRRWNDLVSDPALWNMLLRSGRLKDVVIHDGIVAWTSTWTLQKAIVSQLLKRCVVCRCKTKAFCRFTCCRVCASCASATPRFTKISRLHAKKDYFLTDDDLKSIVRCDERRDKYGWGATWYLLADIEAAAKLKLGPSGLETKQEKSRLRKQGLRDKQAAKRLARKRELMTHLEKSGLSILANEWNDTAQFCLDYANGSYDVERMVTDFKRQHVLFHHAMADSVFRVMGLKPEHGPSWQAEMAALRLFDNAKRHVDGTVSLCPCGEPSVPNGMAREFEIWKKFRHISLRI